MARPTGVGLSDCLASAIDCIDSRPQGIQSPCNPPRSAGSRKHTLAAVDVSLKWFGTDYIDLYQIHRLDHDTPTEEILRALDEVARYARRGA